jgi:hypothetical protein
MFMKVKKLFLSLFSTTIMLTTFFQFSTPKNFLEPKAAVSETKRVWMLNNDVQDWDKDGAATCLYYYGGGVTSPTFPGLNATYDTENMKVFFDIPVAATNFLWVRGNNNCTTDWNSRSNQFSYAPNQYWNLTDTYAWNNFYASPSYTLTDFVPVTTKVVLDFSNKTENLFGNCSYSKVEELIAEYNSLSSFEQNQFDNLDFDGVTGLERLNYLIEVSGATTALN